jgi:hypothetical protein
MLRWKNRLAICALLIAACPLTSHAQQIATPVLPDSAVSRQQAIESPDIIIRAPFLQPHNPNLYLFMVENVGTVDATAALVDLYVPQNVTITNVVPAPATGLAHWTQVRLTNLAAGSKSFIEVEISPTANAVEFQTRMTMESVHTFAAAPQPSDAGRPQSDLIATSKYLIPNAEAPLQRSSFAPLAPLAAANGANAVQAQVDAKLLETVESLRSAGQDALADAYIAAVANSDSLRAETF